MMWTLHKVKRSETARGCRKVAHEFSGRVMKQLSNPIHDLITGLLSLLPMAVCLIAWEVLTEREMVCIGKHVFVYHARYVSMTVGIPHGSTMHVIPWFWMVW